MKKAYLAGGMRGDVSRQIQETCGALLKFLDPKSWEQEFPSPSQYTARDLAAIQEADYVIAFMGPDNPSGYGMSLEVGYAHALKKPIIFLDLLGNDWRSKYFDMVRQVAELRAQSVDDLRNLITAFYA